MNLRLRDRLLFVDLVVVHGGQRCEVTDVLVDTGSAGTVVSADLVGEIGLRAGPGDRLHVLHGVGGEEVVFTKRVEAIEIGGHLIRDVRIEVGAMDYGYAMNGILGLDLLRRAGAVIDLGTMQLAWGTVPSP